MRAILATRFLCGLFSTAYVRAAVSAIAQMCRDRTSAPSVQHDDWQRAGRSLSGLHYQVAFQHGRKIMLHVFDMGSQQKPLPPKSCCLKTATRPRWFNCSCWPAKSWLGGPQHETAC
jgi:hypothetical protein